MFFKLLLVLCSILFDFNPTYSFRSPEDVFKDYETNVLKFNRNEKRHRYCHGRNVKWASLCYSAFVKLRKEEEYKNNLYLNYSVFNIPQPNKCKKTTLVLPNNQKVLQYHIPCPGRPKIFPAVPRLNQSGQIMMNESNPQSYDFEQLHDDYNKISIYPIIKQWMLVLKKNEDGKYNLLEIYKINSRILDENLFTLPLPMSITNLLFLNKMLYSKSDKELMDMSLNSNNTLNSKNKVTLQTICDLVLARPQYGNYYTSATSSVPFRYFITGENIHLFLAYLDNEDYRIVNVLGYRCEEGAAKYRLLAGPNENSLFVLEKDPFSELEFVINELIENVSAKFLGTLGDEG